jgi:hypothetical protein
MSAKRIQRWTCPGCGLDSVVPVIIGFPNNDDFERAARGEIVLAGCVVYGDEPDRPVECLECGWYGERLRGGKIREVIRTFGGSEKGDENWWQK